MQPLRIIPATNAVSKHNKNKDEDKSHNNVNSANIYNNPSQKYRHKKNHIIYKTTAIQVQVIGLIS